MWRVDAFIHLVYFHPISVEASEGWALDLKAYWSDYKDCGTLIWEPVDSQDHVVGQRL
jgi:hypothetical protein